MSREDDLRAYAAHVPTCAGCKHANTAAELCHEGGALWDAIDIEAAGADGPIVFHCVRPADVALFEIVGGALMPLGLFCRAHWSSERELYRSAGSNTGMQITADPWLCCWEPRVVKS